MRAIIFGLISCFLLCAAHSQNVTPPLLERTVTIDITNQTVAEALTVIGAKAGVKFSYSPTQIGSQRLVTLQVKNKPLRIVLKSVLGDGVQYKTRNNFIILTPKPTEKNKPQPEFIVNGYVYNQQGVGVAYASILNVATHRVAVTNQYGYFKLALPITKPTTIHVKKANYLDTSLVIKSKQTQVEVVLQSKQITSSIMNTDTVLITATVVDTVKTDSVLQTETDSATSRIDLIKSWFLSSETKANMRNIGDTLFSKVQFSIIPQLSTSKLLVGNTVNEVSISALVGYAKGINSVGIAGMINAVEGKAKHALVAGVANVVEDSVTGVELAGVANINDGVMSGVQVAGVINVNDKHVCGIQASGVANIAASGVAGLQAAGVINITEGDINGSQTAGVINISEGNITGVQTAGVINITQGNIQGVQVAGVINIAESDTINSQIAGIINATNGQVLGTQVAGIANLTEKNVNGMQLSSILNVGKHINGSQIGLLNFSNQINGLPIGLFSWSNNGYHKLELFADETMYSQMAFRTGVTKFHNIFLAGIDLTNKLSGLWCVGYGVGSLYPMRNNWFWGGEIIAQTYLINSFTSNAVSVYGLNFLMEKQFTKNISIAIGPTVKLMYNDNIANTVADVTSPYHWYNHTSTSGSNTRVWAGAKISLKFF